MAQVLSQEKINQILITVNGASGAVINRPAKFSKEQLQAVSYIHETFANLTACCLTDLLRSMCHIHVSSADELTYEEFIRSVPPPSTLAEINMNPLKGSAILEISQEITFAIIDRICGGSGDGTKFQHELTDIEIPIVENIIVHLLGNMRKAWNQVLDMHPQVKEIDTDPQYFRIVSPYEVVILATLEAKVGETKGMINICIPSSTIEPIMEKLTNWYWNKNQDNTQSASSITEKLSKEKSRRTPKKNKMKKFGAFGRINRNPATLLNFIQGEHPQVIAFVLAHMKPDKASIVLLCLPLDMQSDVLRRIAVMDFVSNEIASEIEQVIENKISSLSCKKNYSIAGGVESAAKIFNRLDKVSSEVVINDLEKEDPELLKEILKRADN